MIFTFIGIDLAWHPERNLSGAAVLAWNGLELQLLSAATPLAGLDAVKSFVDDHLTDHTTVAVDAPLIIRNTSGLRPCEREVGRRYGARHACCHSSNLTLYPNAASVRLESWLLARGFVHGIGAEHSRTMIEVYPHSAFVALFDLPSIIRYKKGNVADKCSGLRIVQKTLSLLPIRQCETLMHFLKHDPVTLRGITRKSFEDTLDSIFCAYLAFHFWRHGSHGSEVFGDLESGYIVNPRMSSFNIRLLPQ